MAQSAVAPANALPPLLRGASIAFIRKVRVWGFIFSQIIVVELRNSRVGRYDFPLCNTLSDEARLAVLLGVDVAELRRAIMSR